MQDSIYEVPLKFEQEGVASVILNCFGMRNKKANLKDWEKIMKKIKKDNKEVRIVLWVSILRVVSL